MSSGRGRSPCDTGPRELRLDVSCPGTLAAASRRNDGSARAADVLGEYICTQPGHAKRPYLPRSGHVASAYESSFVRMAANLDDLPKIDSRFGYRETVQCGGLALNHD